VLNIHTHWKPSAQGRRLESSHIKYTTSVLDIDTSIVCACTFNQTLLQTVLLYYLPICFKHYLCCTGKARSMHKVDIPIIFISFVVYWHSHLKGLRSNTTVDK